MSDAGVAAPRFGAAPELALGLEDELLLVDAHTHTLSHTAVELLDSLQVAEAEGTAKPDAYAAMVELTAPVSASAAEAAGAISALRAKVRAAGGTVIGAGIHPNGAHGDVVHFPAERARGRWTPREALVEASFAAHRDGLDARLPLDGALRPAREVVRATLDLARPFARDLAADRALEGVERILAEGNGADRQRAAFARGGMPAVLTTLVDEAATPYE